MVMKTWGNVTSYGPHARRSPKGQRSASHCPFLNCLLRLCSSSCLLTWTSQRHSGRFLSQSIISQSPSCWWAKPQTPSYLLTSHISTSALSSLVRRPSQFFISSWHDLRSSRTPGTDHHGTLLLEPSRNMSERLRHLSENHMIVSSESHFHQLSLAATP